MQKIPQLWLGMWRLLWDRLLQAVPEALEIGYRHFDTAWIYGNETELWTALQQAAIPRDQLWITSKVWFDYVPNHQAHQFSSSDFAYTQLTPRFESSLKALKTDYLDLILLHRPTTPDNDAQAFETLLQLKKEGKIRQVWVANFPLSQLQKLYVRFGDEIYTDQIEWHACLNAPALESFAKEKKLILTAYSPFWQGNLFKQKALFDLADQLWIFVSQLCIAYLLAKNAVVIPKASSFARLQVNFNAKNLHLSESIIAQIDALPKTYRYCNPPFAPDWDNACF